MKVSRLWTAISIISVLATLHTATATTVYKWTDQANVIHLSDQKPPSEVKHIKALKVPKPTSRGRPSDNYYSIINQARRIQASYLALEHSLAQRRLLNARHDLTEARANYYMARSRLLSYCEAHSKCSSSYYPYYGYYDDALF